MVSWAPGAYATTTSAAGNGRILVTSSTKQEATAIATANEPNAAPRKPNNILGVVLAKRDPATAPSVIIAAPAIHHGRTAWTHPPPCRRPEPIIAPTSRPPGKRSHS